MKVLMRHILYTVSIILAVSLNSVRHLPNFLSWRFGMWNTSPRRPAHNPRTQYWFHCSLSLLTGTQARTCYNCVYAMKMSNNKGFSLHISLPSAYGSFTASNANKARLSATKCPRMGSILLGSFYFPISYQFA